VAQVDCFLKIDGAEGESTDHKHKGEIEVQTWSLGAFNEHTAGQYGGAGAGKVKLQDLHFTSRIGKEGPKLFEFCATGEHAKKAVMVQRKAGKDQQEYLKITFTDPFVTSYQVSGSGESSSLPHQQVSLGYSKVEIEYKEQKPDGTLGGSVKAGWDAMQNKKV